MLIDILSNFGIKGEIVKVNDSAMVQQVLFQPAPRTRFNKIKGLESDIGREISAPGLKIAESAPFVSFEIPKKNTQIVDFEEISKNPPAGALPICLGLDISGEPVWADLAKMPHLLVAGTTGSGKSVGLNCFIYGLMRQKKPNELKFLLIDPKKIEFSIYEDSKYLWRPVVTDDDSALSALSDLRDEMESRYMILEQHKVKNIDELHKKGVKMPYIVAVVDEFADFILSNGSPAEKLIQSLAQKARACGIHLIIATQRPSVDVVTGVIKANFPTRLSYRVATKYDSKTILDESGAEKLLGRGDSLFLQAGQAPRRVFCGFVPDSQIESFLDNYRGAVFPKTQKPKEPTVDAVEWVKNHFILFFLLGYLGSLIFFKIMY